MTKEETTDKAYALYEKHQQLLERAQKERDDAYYQWRKAREAELENG